MLLLSWLCGQRVQPSPFLAVSEDLEAASMCSGGEHAPPLPAVLAQELLQTPSATAFRLIQMQVLNHYLLKDFISTKVVFLSQIRLFHRKHCVTAYK